MNHLIMVVEDEYGNAEILQLLLEAEGFRVALASNGREALELLSGEKPAVVLSDFMMPRLTGAELGAEIRASQNLAAIPFVIVSATSEWIVQEAFKDYDAFVQKPYSGDGLVELVRHLAINGRRRPSERDVQNGIDDPNSEDSLKQILRKVMLPPA